MEIRIAVRVRATFCLFIHDAKRRKRNHRKPTKKDLSKTISSKISRFQKNLFSPYWEKWDKEVFPKVYVQTVVNDNEMLSISKNCVSIFESIEDEQKTMVFNMLFEKYCQNILEEKKSWDENDVSECLEGMMEQYIYEHVRFLAKEIMGNYPDSLTTLGIPEEACVSFGKRLKEWRTGQNGEKKNKKKGKTRTESKNKKENDKEDGRGKFGKIKF